MRELNYMGLTWDSAVIFILVDFKGRRVRSSHCFNASQMSDEKNAVRFGYIVDYNYYPVEWGL